MRSFSYVRPKSSREAVRAFAAAGSEARFLAGGTTLYDLMKLRVEAPAHVIDLTGIDELTRIYTRGSRELVFGSLARMADVAEDRRVRSEYPVLAESLWRAASQQLRNMASVGGNLLQRTRCAYFRGGEPFACNKRNPGSGCSAIGGLDRGHALLGGSDACIAVYPGDWAVALLALDAQVDVLGPKGRRTIPIDQLHREPGSTPEIETALAPGELIVRIRVPVTQIGRASTYHKIRDRESYAFALASAAVCLRMEGEVVRDARISLGGLATRPWRAKAAEQSLVGQRLTADTARKAGELALTGARAGTHNAFRIELGARTVADALMIARSRA
jgi:xanthine dehydrogenase YagS FAD-binding subunit